MGSTDQLVAFFIATALFAALPGPAVLYTAAQTIARGRRAGFLTVAGIHTGCYVHVIAASLGLTALISAVPTAYLVLKLGGAAYLCWIGFGLILKKVEQPDPEQVELPKTAEKSARRAFLESIVVEVLNPKVALFFVAFLPQFVDPAATLPVWAQFLILGVIVNVMFSSADIVTVLVASAVIERARRSRRAGRIMRVAGGSLLVGLGLKLATDRS